MKRSIRPCFSIVIPAYNEEKYLPYCLQSLINQDFPKAKYEIIVVDNGSTDKTAHIASHFKVRVVKETKKGVARARQKGFAAALGEIICSTDADCFIPPYWLKVIHKHFSKDRSLIALGGPIDIIEVDNLIKIIVKFLAPPAFLINPLINKGGDLTSANFAVKKSAFLKVGGFNPKITIGEDVEISKRLRKLGKVRFSNKRSLKIKTSSRRFNQSFEETFKYIILNYCYLKLFNRSYSKQCLDIR